jgi:hypothetical protein
MKMFDDTHGSSKLLGGRDLGFSAEYAHESPSCREPQKECHYGSYAPLWHMQECLPGGEWARPPRPAVFPGVSRRRLERLHALAFPFHFAPSKGPRHGSEDLPTVGTLRPLLRLVTWLAILTVRVRRQDGLPKLVLDPRAAKLCRPRPARPCSKD